MRLTLTLFSMIVLLSSCVPQKPKSETSVKVEDSYGTELFNQAMPSGGKVSDETHGDEVWFAYGAASGIGGTAANGVLMAHRFADGTYVHTAQVNIALEPEGSFYEGWLMHPKTRDVVSTGHLTSHFGDVRHFLKFETDRDLREYTSVQITLEEDDGNPAPSEIQVAGGVLKVTQR